LAVRQFRGDWFQLLQVRGGNRLSSSAFNPDFLRTPRKAAKTRVEENIHKTRGE
jgi:hypothetical protein